MTDLFGDGETIIKTATLSECGRYRYSLGRCWDASLPKLGWVMLNPSTADASIDDPTIKRCIGFARNFGFGGIHVTNLFAWRATKPKALPEMRYAIGPENDDAIRSMVVECAVVVFGWGAHRIAADRCREVLTIIRDLDVDYLRSICALGFTKDGHPRHPLFVPSNTELVEFRQ